MTSNELYTHIQSFTKEMSKKEKDEFYKEAEGFQSGETDQL